MSSQVLFQFQKRARLPALVFIIASFTTTIVLILEAFAFTLYERIALYVQIIVTNCVILARADGYGTKQPATPCLA